MDNAATKNSRFRPHGGGLRKAVSTSRKIGRRFFPAQQKQRVCCSVYVKILPMRMIGTTHPCCGAGSTECYRYEHTMNPVLLSGSGKIAPLLPIVHCGTVWLKLLRNRYVAGAGGVFNLWGVNGITQYTEPNIAALTQRHPAPTRG